MNRCRDCITTFIEKQEDSGKVPSCPACGKAPLKVSTLREVSNNKNAFSKTQPALKKVDFQTSTKLQALIKRLKAIELQDPRYKALVFSQVCAQIDRNFRSLDVSCRLTFHLGSLPRCFR